VFRCIVEKLTAIKIIIIGLAILVHSIASHAGIEYKDVMDFISYIMAVLSFAS